MNGAEDNDENVATHLAGKKRSRSLKNVSSYGSMGFRGGLGKTSNDNESTTSEPRRDQSASLLNYYSEEIVRHPEATGETAQASYQNADEPARLLSTPDAIVKESCCKCKYIIEPMVFLQTLASSIVGIAYGQFVYNRILDRLIEESRNNGTNVSTFSLWHHTDPIPNTTNLTTMAPVITSTLSTSTMEPFTTPINPSQYCNTSHVHSPNLRMSSGHFYTVLMTLATYSMSLSPTFTFPFLSLVQNDHVPFGFGDRGPLPSNFDEIRVKAQEETADLFFRCGIFGGIPVILMANILGVNCSYLGRKFLIIITQIGFMLRFLILLLQCIFPDWPIWVYYVASAIEGVTGSSSVFYMAIHCYIADTTTPSSRSYRLTFVNYINSISGLCVSFLCGYIIKYYGYLYLFIACFALSIVTFLYTVLFIPESLIQLRNRSIFKRISTCSLGNIINSFKVYAPREDKKPRRPLSRDDDSADEADNLLNDSRHDSDDEEDEGYHKTRRQSYILILIVFANFLYNFSGGGLASIFTLFIMNEPFCFDSIEISNYSLFATVVSLFMSLVTSKFVKFNDLFVCFISVLSSFFSILCYIYGKSTYYIYLGAVIGSISGLEYGYARSIISKSFRKEEVPDALSLIVSVDTFIGVVSTIIFPVLYAKVVSTNIDIIFYICDGVVVLVLICHIINWIFYVPVQPERPIRIQPASTVTSPTPRPGANLRKNVSLSEENLNRRNFHLSTQSIAPLMVSCNNLTTDSIIHPFHQSLALSSVEID